jgi:hypothetical protein
MQLPLIDLSACQTWESAKTMEALCSGGLRTIPFRQACPQKTVTSKKQATASHSRQPSGLLDKKPINTNSSSCFDKVEHSF